MDQEKFSYIHSIMKKVDLGWPPSKDHDFFFEMYPVSEDGRLFLRVCLYHADGGLLLEKSKEIKDLFESDGRIEVVSHGDCPDPQGNVKPFSVWDITFSS